MSAKHKLNAANELWAVLIAGLIGWVTGSWIIAGIALAALLVAAHMSGAIRD